MNNNFDKKSSQGFISILNEILNNDEFSNIIRKNEQSNGFIILDQQQFVNQILPKYYRSKSYASFRRSVNIYGFQIRNLTNGQKLFINKNITSIDCYIGKAEKQNLQLPVEQETLSLFLQLNEIKKNQEELQKQILLTLEIQNNIMTQMKKNMINYIQGILDSQSKGKDTEKFVLKFYFSIQNKHYKKFMKNQLKKALQIPNINFCQNQLLPTSLRNSQNIEISYGISPNVCLTQFIFNLRFNKSNFQLQNNCEKIQQYFEDEELYDCESQLSNYFCLNQIEF